MAIRGLGSALFCTLALLASPSARAQTPADALAGKATELRGVQDTLKASEEQRRKIEADVEAIRLDHVRLNQALIETTAKVQDAEGKRADAGARLDKLSEQALALNHALEERRDSIADVLGALERMGENPPPAILVKPDDMIEAVRAAIVISSMTGDMQAQALAQTRDLQKLEAVKAGIGRERDDLDASARALALDKEKLADLVVARQQSLDQAQTALQAERERASELANQALTLKDLIARMETSIPGAKAGAEAAAAAAILGVGKNDPSRLKPAVAFAEAKGTLALPVVGAVLKSFGAADDYGGAEKGLSIATPPKATVSTPIDGWVVYAGLYRTYGQLLILNAGDGYYMVLAGMERINVSVGQFVLAGEAVAAMGDGSARTATAAAICAAQPVLYIELRKNETAIDPGPWWAKNVIEKAHG